MRENVGPSFRSIDWQKIAKKNRPKKRISRVKSVLKRWFPGAKRTGEIRKEREIERGGRKFWLKTQATS